MGDTGALGSTEGYDVTPPGGDRGLRGRGEASLFEAYSWTWGFRPDWSRAT